MTIWIVPDRVLERWLCEGFVSDPYAEFMVQEHKVAFSNCQPCIPFMGGVGVEITGDLGFAFCSVWKYVSSCLEMLSLACETSCTRHASHVLLAKALLFQSPTPVSLLSPHYSFCKPPPPHPQPRTCFHLHSLLCHMRRHTCFVQSSSPSTVPCP